MSSVKPHLLHFANFKGTAGIENQIHRFIRSTEDLFEHSLQVIDRPIHEKYRSYFEEHCNVNFYKTLGPVKIPKFLSSLRTGLSKRWITNRDIDHAFIYQKLHQKKIIRGIMDTVAGNTIFYDQNSSWSNSDEHLSLIQEFDHIVSISRASKIMLTERTGYNPDNITRIPNSLPEPEFNDFANGGTGDLKLPDRINDKFKILFVGRLDFQKGVNTLIRMCRHLNAEQFHLLIVGDGNEAGSLRALADEFGVNDTITFFGHDPNPKRFFSVADAMVLPSVFEPFGIVNLEAGAAGLPVVASNVDGIADIIDNGSSGFLVKPTVPIDHFRDEYDNPSVPEWVVDPESETLTKPKFCDPEQLASRIKRLKNNPEQRKKFGRRLHRTVKDDFLMNDTIESITEMIESLE